MNIPSFWSILIVVLFPSCSIMVDPDYGSHASRVRSDLPASAVHGLWHRKQHVGGYDFTDTFLFRPDGSGLSKSRSVQGSKVTDHAVRSFHWKFNGTGNWTMWFDDSPAKLFDLHTDGTVLLRTYSSSAGLAREVLTKI
jgi:hypothetical protein